MRIRRAAARGKIEQITEQQQRQQQAEEKSGARSSLNYSLRGTTPNGTMTANDEKT
jgi:hypothetical protein